MADDAPSTPPDRQLVQWLRALADAVESDPDLATRVTQGMAATPPTTTEAPPAMVPETAPAPLAAATPLTVPDPALLAAATPPPTTEPEPSPPAALSLPAAEAPAPEPAPTAGTIAPTLRHTRKVSRFGPSVAGRPADLGTGVPDPFAVFAKDGEDGLRRALGALRVGTLRAIIRAHDLDPAGKLGASASEKRLITAIIAAVKRGAAGPAPKAPAKTSRQRSRPTPPVIH